MFKSLILLILFINLIFAKRAYNCYGVDQNPTRSCCNQQNGMFEPFGKLGVCHNPENGQDEWRSCCVGFFNSYQCWDD